MQYTTLGKRTGLKVSVLGFGAMRLPMKGETVDYDKAVPMMQLAFKLGVNYVDSAVGYCNHDSQVAVGMALKGWRDKIVVSTKNPSYRRTEHDAFRRNLEESLRHLDVDCIDIYSFHSLRWQSFTEHVDGEGGSYRWMLKAKEEGLIKHICFSFHDTPEALVKLARMGLFDVVTCQYNLLDRRNGEAFKAVRDAGMGIVVMGPVGGGRLGVPSRNLQKLVPGAKSVPEVALRFVIANPYVNVALSGMSEMRHVEENCRVASRKTSLTPADRRRVTVVLDRYKKLADLYCTGCKYCMPCPAGVNIPGNFDSLNQLRVYGLEELAKRRYKQTDNRAALCLACGKCMPKCPQNIDIISQLRETVRRLDDAYGKLAVRLSPGKLRKFAVRKGTCDVELAARLEFVNFADQDTRPEVAFYPGRGVEVGELRAPPVLAAFQRAAMPVTIKAAVKPGEAIATGLEVRCEQEVLGAVASLSIAVARPGGKKAMAKACLQPLKQDDPACKPPAAVAGRHGAKFSLAYDADSLYVQALVKDDAKFAPKASAKRDVSKADRIEVSLDMTGLARPQGDRAPHLHWTLQAGLPDADTGECHVHFSKPRWRKVEGVTISHKKAGGAVALTIRIPWKTIECPPGKAGRAFGLNVAHVSHSARGKVQCHRLWAAAGGGWAVLA